MDSESRSKYFLYARKSTESEDRQARSIPDQLAELRELARKAGIEVLEILTESQSAKRPGRPIFNDMLARIEKGEASGILSWNPDRLSRNSLDGGRLIWLVDIGAIKDLRFPTYTFEPTPAGKLMLAVAFGMSKYQVDRLSEDIKRGVRQKLKRGIWPQKAPLGYLNDRQARTIYPDPVRAPLIRKAFELYATGQYTFAKLRDVVNQLGLMGETAPLSVSNYQYMLNNPIYYGLIRYKGELYDGKHEPIISKQLFDACQSVMLRRQKPKDSKLKLYLYRGFFHCGECGCLITTETQKGHDYLRCTKRKGPCSQPYVRAEAVEEQVTAAISHFALEPTWADWMVAELQKERDQNADAHDDTIQQVRSRIAVVTEKSDRLIAAYSDGALSLEELRTAKNRLVQEKRGFEDQVILLEKNRTTWFEPAIRFVQAAKQATFLLEQPDPVKHRDFFRKAGSNRTILNKRVA